MAGRLQMVHSGIWLRQDLRALRPIPRLTYFHLRTNERTGISGLYVQPFEIAVAAAAIEPEAFREALVALREAGLLLRCEQTGAMWVRDKLADEIALCRSGQLSPKTAAAVVREVGDVPDCDVRRAFLKRYVDQVPELEVLLPAAPGATRKVAARIVKKQAAQQQAGDDPWSCFRCHHRHASVASASVLKGACPTCHCTKTGPFSRGAGR